MSNLYDPNDPYMKVAGLIWFVFSLILCLVFLVLKLTAVIAWGWLWIFSPIWIPMGISLLLLMAGFKP